MKNKVMLPKPVDRFTDLDKLSRVMKASLGILTSLLTWPAIHNY